MSRQLRQFRLETHVTCCNINILQQHHYHYRAAWRHPYGQ